MKAEDIKQLQQMREQAPNTWRCSSTYYQIAARYGITMETEDRVRDLFIDRALRLVPKQEGGMKKSIGALMDKAAKSRPRCVQCHQFISKGCRTVRTRKGIQHETCPPTRSLTYAELSTILAALRNWQQEWADPKPGYTPYPPDCSEHFEKVAPLTGAEIDSLCERLNGGEIVTVTGGPKK